MRRPPTPRRGPRGRNRRHLFVRDVDLGNGQRVTIHLSFDQAGVSIHVFRSKKRRWYVPLAEAAGLLARRGQLREAMARMGRSV